MKHSLSASLLALASVALQATAAVVDYVDGELISSSSYYQYHTKWATTTCYETITKTSGCSYDGGDYAGDYAGDYETVSPQVYPGPEYNDYKTIYETVYETAHPYPYESAHPYPYESALPYPYETVCHPETVYSTVYPDSSDIIYHTFTASGTDETVTGSPVYHTMDSTIVETVIATPSGGSDSECSDGPWITNPGFEGSWPGAWFRSSGSVELNNPPDAVEGSWVAEFSNGPTGSELVAQLDQAIIIPNGLFYWVHFWVRYPTAGAGTDQPTITFSLGSYASRTLDIPLVPNAWIQVGLNMGQLNGPSECFPVVYSIKVTFPDGVNPDRLQIDNVSLTATVVPL